jgi:recombination protein RecA
MATRKKETAEAQEVSATEVSGEKPVKKGKDAKSQLGALLAMDIVKSLQKDHGANILITGTEVKARKQNRIPSGIFPLDLALEGGWAQGGVHTLYGHKSSFKTTALYHTFGSAQKMCANCWTHRDACSCKNYREPVIAYVDVEGALDHKWASRFFKVEDILVSTPDHAEQSLTIGEALLRSRKCDILAIDSLAFLTPAKEIEEDISKSLVGEQARLLNKAVRKFVSALNAATTEGDQRTTVFFTNQIRMKIGVMFGNPETVSGGLAPGFMAWSEVRMKGGKYKMDELGERPLYADFGFSVEKSKNSTPRMASEFRMMLAETPEFRLGEIDDSDFTVTRLEREGAISGGGASWSCLGEKFSKKAEIAARLMTDRDFREKARSFLIQASQT